MDDVKGKFKGFMMKMNNQLSSSSSGKFKGQGRVLGSGPSPSSGPTNPIHAGHAQPVNPKPIQTSSSSNSESLGEKSSDPPQKKPALVPNRENGSGFDPFESLITTGKRSQHGYSLNVLECPICGGAFRSEEEVSLHVDSCVNGDNSKCLGGSDDVEGGRLEESSRTELEACVGVYLSGKPPEGSVEVVLRLLRNVVKEPENVKFRRIRMGNPKIREAVTEVAGGVELLEFVGFELKEEGGEMWAVREDVPKEETIGLINEVTRCLERKEDAPAMAKDDKPSVAGAEMEEEVISQKIDRQIQVFFSVPESVAAKIELPDSFYNLSVEEIKREADCRKKRMAESLLLIPRSYREKQAKATRKRYVRTIIRVQFPDGVVLQGVFAPWEPTTALYEFVKTALKDASLEFELLDPVLVKRRVIPRFPASGQRATALDDEGLVPSALIKFRPIETDSSVFTGLCNELLEISEPLA